MSSDPSNLSANEPAPLDHSENGQPGAAPFAGVCVESRPQFLLDDPEAVWLVQEGAVNVFTVAIADGAIAGAWHFGFQMPAATALFGATVNRHGHALLAVPMAGAQLVRHSRSTWTNATGLSLDVRNVADWMDQWLSRMCAALARGMPAPREFLELIPAAEVRLAAGQAALSRHEVLWVAPAAHSRFLGAHDLAALPGSIPLPLGPQTWLIANTETHLTVADTAKVLEQVEPWKAFDAFQLRALQWLGERQQATDQGERQRLIRKAELETRLTSRALARLVAVVQPAGVADLEASGDLVWDACRLLAENQGITLPTPSVLLEAPPETDPPQATREPGAGSQPRSLRIGDILRRSGARYRQIVLHEGWWREDGGAFLGYLRDDPRPVAVLTDRRGHYWLHDPKTSKPARVTAAVAGRLRSTGYVFYRPFPPERISFAGLLRFGMRGAAGDLARVCSLGFVVALLGLLVPVFTAILFDTVVPSASATLLAQLVVALGISVVSTAILEVVRDIALLRIQGRIEATLMAAVWDRVLNLPATFFRNYTAGDLADRASSVSYIRDHLTGAALTVLIGGAFGAVNLLLLFFYLPRLGVVATILLLALLVLTAPLTYRRVHCLRHSTALSGTIQGLVLQLITGIAKLRVAGAEQRAFVHWADEFARMRSWSYRAARTLVHLTWLSAVFGIVSLIVIFGGLTAWGTTASTRLPVGDFLGFMAAFNVLMSTLTVGLSTVMAVLEVGPLYERCRPILEAIPEERGTGADPGELRGAIQISRLVFRYRTGGPAILNEVSINIRPGEFVALVGSSGSGKSTLLRLLLGMENPETGTISYDGLDLATLNRRAVRQQIGTVLQNAQVVAGTLYENIAGARSLTQDEALEAARRAGFAEDVAQMPMGLQTIVSQGGGTLSGGQRQRLLIARALAMKPRILFFDEATSALDNRTQAHVSRSLEGMEATRVVIAHRLSTILKADRIYVLEEGRVVQTGTYEELIVAPGPFSELARRQLVDG
jgi:NHLM bacteriocin system ABC transporter ATP-binding protein